MCFVTCLDIDECETGDNDCHDNANCTNRKEGYNCTCNDGYDGDGFNNCTGMCITLIHFVVRMCLIHNMVEYTYMYIYYTISLIMIDYWHTVSVEYCFQW